MMGLHQRGGDAFFRDLEGGSEEANVCGLAYFLQASRVVSTLLFGSNPVCSCWQCDAKKLCGYSSLPILHFLLSPGGSGRGVWVGVFLW